MALTTTKEEFLSNKENKQRFIFMLGEELSQIGCTVFHDTGDADCLIVKKTMESAAENNVVLVGDDTDLLILLLHQQYEDKHDVYFAPEPKKKELESADLGSERCQGKTRFFYMQAYPIYSCYAWLR